MENTYSIQITVYGNDIEREALLADLEGRQNLSYFKRGSVIIINFESNVEPTQEWLSFLKEKHPTFIYMDVFYFRKSSHFPSDEKNLTLISASDKEFSAIENDITYVKCSHLIRVVYKQLRTVENMINEKVL